MEPILGVGVECVGGNWVIGCGGGGQRNAWGQVQKKQKRRRGRGTSRREEWQAKGQHYRKETKVSRNAPSKYPVSQMRELVEADTPTTKVQELPA